MGENRLMADLYAENERLKARIEELRGREQKIYDELASLYGSPCNFSPQDEVMLMRGRCEDCCGDISDAECWQRYFSVRLGGEQNDT